MKKILAMLLVLAMALSLAACGPKNEDKTIKVGATPAPHAEILEVIKEALAAEGWTLEIVEFNDYVQPNQALEDGELDANYFQHVLYLNQFNDEYGTHLVNAGGIHYEPFGIFAGKTASIDALPFFVAAVALLHRWRGNVLLSIGGGTALYMLLVQLVF